MRDSTARAIRNQRELFERWPANKAYWLKPDGSEYQPGETIKLPTLARTLQRMVEAERGAKGPGPRRRPSPPRATASTRATSRRRWSRFSRSTRRPSTSPTSRSSSRASKSRRSTTYRGYTVYKHGFGSQGPVLLQTLNILEHFDLRAMGYGSADYLHTVVEAMKLAYADRDTYYADPAFVRGAGRGAAVEGLREGARGADRSEEGVDVVHRRRSAEARLAREGVDASGRPT